MDITSPEDVCLAVSLDLKAQGLTQQDVANAIGKSRAVVSNLLSSKKRFSKTMAILFHQEYQYSLRYLLFGEGQLKDDFDPQKQVLHNIQGLPISADSRDANEDIYILASMIDIADGIIHSIGNKDALSAWNAIMMGDYSRYVSSMKRLSRNNAFIHSPFMARFVCQKMKDKIESPNKEEISKSDSK